MTKFVKHRSILFLTCALMAGASAFAGTITWTGAISNFWNTTDANWSGTSTIYANGDNVTFSGTSGVITNIVSRSPGSTVVNSANKVTFSTDIYSATPKVIGGPSILTGTLVKNGTGELELGDPLLGQQFGPAADRNKYSNSFSSVTVNGGTLRIRSRAALGTGTVTLAGGTKFIQASEEGRFNASNEHIDNSFVLSGGLVEFPMAFGNDNKGSWFRNGTVSGPGGIRVTGSSRTLALQGNNTYQGGTMIDTTGDAGLLIASYTALGIGTFTANQNQLTGGAGFIAGIDLSGNGTYPNGVTNPIVINSGKFLNVSGNSASTGLRLGGNISGLGTLNKWKNDSILILSGNNTYSGGTIVADGTLVCATENSLGGGPLAIAAGALLQLDFVGTGNVPSLKLDGSPVANGTWGSSSSPAEHQDNVHFAGFGMVTVGPPKTPTATAIAQTAGSNPTNIGLSVTFTATVSGGTPTGTVAFYDGITQLGSATLDGSYHASVSTTALPEGTRNVVAQYQGNSTYASSTSSPLPVQVVDSRPATTTTLALTTGATPSPLGASVTYTATVAGASPTGLVLFYDRDNLIGSIALNGSFQASVSTSTLPPGVRLITAQYEGNVGNKPSSGTFNQQVNAPAGNGKLKVFILAGQSNMQGHGRTELGRNPEDLAGPLIVGGIGSLRGAATRDPLKYGYLLDKNNLVGGLPSWITRNDVYISYWDTVGGTTAVKRAGYLDALFGVATDNRIGPEYAFGHVVGAGLGDKVLIIKTAWGGKSLYVDFRPPSSGGTVGPFYLDMVNKVHTVLTSLDNNLTTYYPGYDGAGYELAGFGWHQGWNDRGNSAAVAEYEANLANLIRDLRTEFGVPGMPVVIANTGMASAPSGLGSLIEAQGNVALKPEFAGRVITVDTRPFDYGTFQSPIDQGYHWNGNGESYFQIGEIMGQAMLSLQTQPPTGYAAWAADPAQGLTKDVNDGLLDDPDFDGIFNFLEFVLRGNPLVSDPGILPEAFAPSGGNWVFEYNRNKLSSPGVTQIVQYTTNFSNWTDVPIPETSAGIVTITPGTNTDKVSVAIPVMGPSGFARLKVVE